MKHIAKITISTKKGHSQETQWLIEQSRPYPTLTSNGSGIEWQNIERLWPKYGQKGDAATIGTEYRCALLRSDFDPANAKDNRVDYAGYDPAYHYIKGEKVILPPNPGAIELRGKSLGEMLITFGNNPDYPGITVRGFNGQPTPSERDWIKIEIIPALRAYIAANAASLKDEAVSALKRDTENRIAAARQEIAKADAKMQAVIANL